MTTVKPDGRALLGRFDHHRPSKLPPHPIHVCGRHHPVGSRYPRRPEQPLRHVLVHRHGAPESPAPCIGDADDLEKCLEGPVLTPAPVQCKKQHVRVPHDCQVPQSGQQKAALEVPQGIDRWRGGPDAAGEEPGLVGRRDEPRTVSTTATSWPRVRRAAMTWTEEARATSRSEEVPPVRTVIRMSPGSDQLLQHIIPADDPDHLAVLPDQGRRALPGQHGAHPIGRRGGVHLGEG